MTNDPKNDHRARKTLTNAEWQRETFTAPPEGPPNRLIGEGHAGRITERDLLWAVVVLVAALSLAMALGA